MTRYVRRRPVCHDFLKGRAETLTSLILSEQFVPVEGQINLPRILPKVPKDIVLLCPPPTPQRPQLPFLETTGYWLQYRYTKKTLAWK